MAIPAFSDEGSSTVGAGDSETNTVTVVPVLPSFVNPGDIIIFVATFKTAGPSISFFSVDSSFTFIGAEGNSTQSLLAAAYMVCNGTEAGASYQMIAAYESGASTGIGQVYRITNTDRNSFQSLGSTTSGTGTSASIPSVGPTIVPSTLAVALISSDANTTISDASGESGGNWSKPVSEISSLSGGSISIQTANLTTSNSTISGGSATLGTSSSWRSISFALRESGFSPPFHPMRGISHLIVR